MSKTSITTKSIKELLDQSAANLNVRTVDELRAVRGKALERHQAMQHFPVRAWLAQHGILSWPKHHSPANWGFALILLVCVLGTAGYMNHANDHDNSEIDIAILTDDLPVDAYVD